MEEIKYYVLFNTHTEGMKLESYLKKASIKYVISPTPRQLSSCCGISIMYNKDDEEKIKHIVEQYDVKIKGFYDIKRERKNFYL